MIKNKVMEEFNLEKYQTGNYDVVTRDGRQVRIICVDRKVVDCHYIVALIEQDDIDSILSYKLNGHYNYYDNDEPIDLMLIKKRWYPKGQLYWHIYIVSGKLKVGKIYWSDDECGNNRYEQGNCFKTEEEAKEKLKEFLEILKK